MRLKVPPKTTIGVHTHPATENVTVLSGTLYFAAGDKLEPKNAKAFGPGSYFSIAQGKPMFAYTKDKETIVQLHGTGPWGAPGTPVEVVPPPDDVHGDWSGVTVCMHVRGYQCTTASLIADLPSSPGAPLRAWASLGTPCTGLFLPVALATIIGAQVAGRVIGRLGARPVATIGLAVAALGTGAAAFWAGPAGVEEEGGAVPPFAAGACVRASSRVGGRRRGGGGVGGGGRRVRRAIRRMAGRPGDRGGRTDR